MGEGGVIVWVRVGVRVWVRVVLVCGRGLVLFFWLGWCVWGGGVWVV